MWIKRLIRHILICHESCRGLESQLVVMNDWKKLANPTFEEVEVRLDHSHPDPQVHNTGRLRAILPYNGPKRGFDIFSRYCGSCVKRVNILASESNDWLEHRIASRSCDLQVALFIISTTGNGDAPENAEKFWRFVKRRTHPKDMLAKMQYSVLVSQSSHPQTSLHMKGGTWQLCIEPSCRDYGYIYKP